VFRGAVFNITSKLALCPTIVGFARHQEFNNIMAAINQQIAEEQKDRALMLIG